MPRISRHLAAWAAAAAALILLAPAGVPHGHRATAADRGLVVLIQTHYVPVPSDGLVRVTLDAVATSYTPNVGDTLPYYSGFRFQVPAEAEAVAASSAGTPLVTDLSAAHESFRELEVTFSQDVFFGETYGFQVTFELHDTGGAPDRDVRVGPSIVAFPVFAFGSPGEAGSGVEVVLPPGFRASVQGSAMATTPGPDGEVVLSADDLGDPFDFYAYLAADHPGTFGEHRLRTTIAGQPASLWVRSWEDDPDWGTRMSDLMSRGLPALQQLIGLPYPVSGTLKIEEAAPTRLGDYAGIYTQATGTILVRYDADPYVGLHEAAHVWFNQKLVDERWIDEAFAELYGVQAAGEIGATGEGLTLTDDLLPHRIPLNDWGALGTLDADTELFAYAASYRVSVLILDRTDLAGLRRVWKAMADDEMSYQPLRASGDPQTGVDANLAPWQQLLDLLDERTGSSYDDLWDEWVVNDAQRSQLDDRAEARDRYEALLARTDGWNLPRDLRASMGAWRFTAAETEIGVAGDVLAARDRIDADAGALALTPPDALQQAFEGDGGLAAAKAEAGAELDALAGIAAATKVLDAEPNPFEVIGLVGSDPAATLDAARDAFEAARSDAALAAASEAVTVRQGAEAAGQLRAGAGGGAVVLLGGVVFVGARVRRRRRAATALAEQATPVPLDPPSPGFPGSPA